MIKSAYIHIPFCKTICSYCDFCKFYYNKNWINKYLNSLEYEIKKDYKNDILDTIYIGGGTPSSLTSNELIKLFNITKIFNLSDNYEFTIEFNIEDITKEKLEICKNNRVNRISIGVESFNKNNLEYLGRNTNINIKDKINLVKKYFNNINIDLIYALPIENIKILEEDLDAFLSLDISHISCYSLIIEKHTKLYNNHIKNISEDIDYDMFKLINTKLNKYNHYEISNYALDGYESRANLTYWNNNNYYGFGVGASSYIDNIRYDNSKNIINYMNKIYNKNKEILTKEDTISYELILGFRKLKGINIDNFNKKYNIDIMNLYNIKDLVNKKILEIKDNYIFISDKYLYVSNEILVNFI